MCGNSRVLAGFLARLIRKSNSGAPVGSPQVAENAKGETVANRFSVVAKTSSQLCREWNERSSAFGWAFPSDWHVPAVDAVCDAITADVDAWAAAERLGRTRAAAGVSLAETLVDIDGLAAVAPGRYTEPLRRAVSLGWSDRIMAPPSTVADPLTGLVTSEYLRVRLGELYREAGVRGEPAGARSSLVVIRLDLNGHSGWQRTLPMILVGEAMRTVFDGGQSLALLSDAVAVALSDRDAMLARRARLLCSMITEGIELDPGVAVPPPAVWIEALPQNYSTAVDLMVQLGR